MNLLDEVARNVKHRNYNHNSVNQGLVTGIDFSELVFYLELAS